MGKAEDVIDVDANGKIHQFGHHFKNTLITISVIILVLLLLWGGIYRLETGTVAVVTRYGDILKVNERAGIHFKIPYVDQVQKVNMQQVVEMQYGFRAAKDSSSRQEPAYVDNDETKQEEAVIVDGKSNNASIVLLNLIVRYQVNDPVSYLYEVDQLEQTMRLALEDVVRSTMQAFTMDQAVEQKEEIDSAVLPALQKKLDKYNAGIRITQVTTQNVDYLDQVDVARQKVEESNQYKRGREEEAEKYINTVIPTANAEATKMYEGAKGYSAEVIAQANADVAEFEALYSEYIQNPEVVKEKYYMEAMQEVLKNNQFIIDQTDNGNLLKFFDVNKNGMTLEEKASEKEETNQ